MCRKYSAVSVERSTTIARGLLLLSPLAGLRFIPIKRFTF